MQMTVKTSGFDSAIELMSPKRIVTATRRAISTTAYGLRNEYSKLMPSIFDRPTRFTTNAFFSQVQEDRLSAKVGVKDQALKYLRPHVIGGSRSKKQSEYQLGSLYTPSDVLVSGGFGGGLDAYGNIKGAYLSQLLSHLRLKVGGIGNRKKASPYFRLLHPRGHLPAGVFWGYKSGKERRAMPVLIFVDRMTYKKRFDFYGIGKAYVDQHYRALLLSQLVKTFNFQNVTKGTS